MLITASTELIRSIPLKEAVSSVARTGFHGIEIWMDHWQRDGSSAADLRKWLQQSGLRWTAHADSRDLNITSINPGIRRESVRQIRKNLERAARLEAELLTVHPGHLSSSKHKAEDYWPIQEEVWNQIGEAATRYGVRVAVENMEPRSGETIITLTDLERLISMVTTTELHITLDVGHLFGQANPEDYVRSVSRIDNVHLSDFAEGKGHMPLGKGNHDYQSLLGVLAQRYKGLVVLEGYAPGWESEILPYQFSKWMEYINSR